MAVITFMSDFGTEDYYVAAVKAKILARSPNQMLVDITHHIRAFDISHAANILKNTYKEFPKGTVHLVAVDSMKDKPEPVAIRLDDHFFVGFNSGLFSLITTKKPDMVCKIWSTNGVSTFVAKDILADAALKLAQGDSLNNIGKPLLQLKELMPRQLKVTKREIVGNVTHIDRYGNLITNIDRESFEKMLELNGDDTQYQVLFAREKFNIIHQDFTDVDSGDCYVFFNSEGLLQIGINKGNASQLLGLRIDAPITIEFTKP